MPRGTALVVGAVCALLYQQRLWQRMVNAELEKALREFAEATNKEIKRYTFEANRTIAEALGRIG